MAGKWKHSLCLQEITNWVWCGLLVPQPQWGNPFNKATPTPTRWYFTNCWTCIQIHEPIGAILTQITSVLPRGPVGLWPCWSLLLPGSWACLTVTLSHHLLHALGKGPSKFDQFEGCPEAILSCLTSSLSRFPIGWNVSQRKLQPYHINSQKKFDWRCDPSWCNSHQYKLASKPHTEKV